jgi:anti-sigma-K factor RskA
MVDTPEPPRREDLAAELALGLLDGEERAEALRLCLSDPGFAAAVESWGLKLAPLLADIPAAAPPPPVWTAIEARLDASPPAGVVRRLRLWRLGALGSAALAASLALFIFLQPPELAPRTEMAVAQLTGAGGAQAITVAYDPEQGVLHVSQASLGGQAKGPELWVIPADGVPRSLGMIAGEARNLPVGAGLRSYLKEGATLAVTLEDPATAPHAAPTSTPILTGKISTI